MEEHQKDIWSLKYKQKQSLKMYILEAKNLNTLNVVSLPLHVFRLKPNTQM